MEVNKNIWSAVDEVAKNSNCLKRHVGCIIVDENGMTLGAGFNYHEDGICDCGTTGESTALHAEAMAIRSLVTLDPLQVRHAYVNHKMCVECKDALNSACTTVTANPTSKKFADEQEDMINDTLKARGSTHGDFAESAIFVQDVKDRMRQTDNWYGMAENKREALDMITHKIGRILHGDYNHKDNWHDIQGYAKLIEDEL